MVLEKRETVKPINQHIYDQYERVLTYEGPDYHSRVVPLRGYLLPNHIEKVCHFVVQHINAISSETVDVRRLVLLCKIDKHDNIYLLHCSYLSLESADDYDRFQAPMPRFLKVNPNSKEKHCCADSNVLNKVPFDHVSAYGFSATSSKPFEMQK